VGSPRSEAFAASAYTPAARFGAAACVAISRASLPAILLFGFVLVAQSIEPVDLVRLVLVAAVAPGCAAWLVARATAVEVAIDEDRIVISGWRRIEIPTASLAGIEPWTLPLPAPGLWLRLASGRRLRWGLTMTEPAALVSVLARRGLVDATAAAHPAMVYATERVRRAPGWIAHPLVKFVVFALAPTAVVFNADQYIMYGGTFGQYYLEGALQYLRTFLVDWGLVALYLVLYASLWRAGAEAVSWVAAWVVPARAGQIRAVAEYACLVGFYGGVPLLLALRFLS
jgi:apolipoprotein N-acyltransferase